MAKSRSDSLVPIFPSHPVPSGDRMAAMTTHSKDIRSSVIPGLRYRNAKVMIDWLCEVFGFERQVVHAGPGDIVMHAQLTLGNGMIMVGSVNNGTPSSGLLKQPDETGGAETITLPCRLGHQRGPCQGQEGRRKDADGPRGQGICGQGVHVRRSRGPHLARRDLRSVEAAIEAGKDPR